MIDVSALRALLAAATPGPWTEDDGSLYGPNDGAVAHIARHASMHTVMATGEDWSHADAALIAAAVNALPALLDELEALRAERDELQSHCDVLETVAENRYATLSEMAAKRDREDQEMIAIPTLCWFLRWVLDEDERRALREFRLEYLLFFEAGVRASEERFVDAHRELQRRGF